MSRVCTCCDYPQGTRCPGCVLDGRREDLDMPEWMKQRELPPNMWFNPKAAKDIQEGVENLEGQEPSTPPMVDLSVFDPNCSCQEFRGEPDCPVHGLLYLTEDGELDLTEEQEARKQAIEDRIKERMMKLRESQTIRFDEEGVQAISNVLHTTLEHEGLVGRPDEELVKAALQEAVGPFRGEVVDVDLDNGTFTINLPELNVEDTTLEDDDATETP